MLLQVALFCSFHGWVIFHCTYVSHLLYPFPCWWTFRLPPCLGCYKLCCGEHWGAGIFFNFPDICQKMGLLDRMITIGFWKPPLNAGSWICRCSFAVVLTRTQAPVNSLSLKVPRRLGHSVPVPYLYLSGLVFAHQHPLLTLNWINSLLLFSTSALESLSPCHFSFRITSINQQVGRNYSWVSKTLCPRNRALTLQWNLDHCVHLVFRTKS